MSVFKPFFKCYMLPFIFSSIQSILASSSFLVALCESEICCTSSRNFDISCLHFFLFFMRHSGYFLLLTRCVHFFVSSNFGIKQRYIYFTMPFEPLHFDFSNKSYANFKKIHTFFFLFRSSILNLLYLYNFGYPGSEIASYCIPKSLLYNSTSLTNIGFFKKKLCPISHNDLIIDWFSRANLYGVPSVIILTFGSKHNTSKTTICALLVNFYKIQIRCSERNL